MPVVRYELKPIRWLGASRAAVRGFSLAARATTGDELFRLQVGLEPKRWREL
jgi:phage-related protein